MNEFTQKIMINDLENNTSVVDKDKLNKYLNLCETRDEKIALGNYFLKL